jgi:hypothetical protein
MGIGRVRMALSENYSETPFVGSVSTYIVVFCATIKTATALGLTIPPSLLGRADEVIQRMSGRGQLHLRRSSSHAGHCI